MGAPQGKRKTEAPEAARATPEDRYFDAVADEKGPEAAAEERLRYERQQAAKVVSDERKKPGLDMTDRFNLLEALVKGVEIRTTDGQGHIVVTRTRLDWDGAVAAVATHIQQRALEGSKAELMGEARRQVMQREYTEAHEAGVAAEAKRQGNFASLRKNGPTRNGLNSIEIGRMRRLMGEGLTWDQASRIVISGQVEEASLANWRKTLEAEVQAKNP